MSLNKAQLKTDVKTILTDLMQSENVGIDEFATRLSDAIDDYVKDAEIKYTSGLNAGSNTVTGTFNGKLE